jgi:hypothetical protein
MKRREDGQQGGRRGVWRKGAMRGRAGWWRRYGGDAGHVVARLLPDKTVGNCPRKTTFPIPTPWVVGPPAKIISDEKLKIPSRRAKIALA